MGVVSLTKTKSLDPRDGITEAVEKAGGIPNKADRISIKINLCEFRTPETGAVTDPRFLEAFLSYLHDQHKPEEIFVVESNATAARPNLIMKWLGFDKILERFHARWVNLSEAPTRPVKVQGRHFKQLDIPEILLETCLISMAKLKTHILTTISCSLKNSYGCIPYPRKIAFHPVIDDAIVDVNLALRPGFSIIDGVIAHVGTQGPAFGVPVRANVILAGTDPVSVDAACCKILKFRPFFVGHLRKAHFSKVGSIKPEIVGAQIDEVSINPEYDSFERFALSLARRLRTMKSGKRATEV